MPEKFRIGNASSVLVRFDDPSSQFYAKPEQFDHRHDADPDAKTQQASDCCQKIDPGLRKV
jgi:hypothetical protein